MVIAVLSTAVVPASAVAGWTWPVRGDVLTRYANAGEPYAAGQHRGIDVGAPIGTPVVAAAGGTVRFSGIAGSSGLTVSIRTADARFDTSYLHLTSAMVRPGQSVGTGERIGTVGISGRGSSPAPHLHFGVRIAGTRRAYRDPLDLLPARPGFRDAPRGVPVAVRIPERVGPAPQPLPRLAFEAAPRLPQVHPDRSRAGWAIACGALILAAALAGARRSTAGRRSRSSIGPRAVLRHHADLLRQR
jgi:murein DD-endopeptidase MepM/ murein hydrolase activator NlpD